MNQGKYPELDKLLEIDGNRKDALSSFLEFLDENDIVLCRRNEQTELHMGAYDRIRENYEELLARFFGVDMDLVEKERRAFLEEFTRASQTRLMEDD